MQHSTVSDPRMVPNVNYMNTWRTSAYKFDAQNQYRIAYAK